ncbi:hypothetical protein QAD02_011193 [Eretmocerus hayati]|uniref:Uncharacterized protein n=1 Tax=Eretmocerus hayati TaxID=131215 RepID=A0ACC2NWD9_9HYME|nr:hypothetical protein QAD02_011193 [Eretmocerus hayati]
MGRSQGSSGLGQLEKGIECVKYTLFCLSAVVWLVGTILFIVSAWLRLEPGFQEWIEFLDIGEFYIGIDILIVSSLLVFFISFVSCASALMEQQLALLVNAGLQGLCFLLGIIGTIVLLCFSTHDSAIQPLIKRSMTNLIVNSHHEHVSVVLKMVQENIGCCGADGPNDYTNLMKPLPSECRDSVTGNAFFHGCVDELSWFLEARAIWVAGLALSLCMMHVVQAVLSLILIEAIKKEEVAYNR